MEVWTLAKFSAVRLLIGSNLMSDIWFGELFSVAKAHEGMMLTIISTPTIRIIEVNSFILITYLRYWFYLFFACFACFARLLVFSFFDWPVVQLPIDNFKISGLEYKFTYWDKAVREAKFTKKVLIIG
jgi:hypothetical protein